MTVNAFMTNYKIVFVSCRYPGPYLSMIGTGTKYLSAIHVMVPY